MKKNIIILGLFLIVISGCTSRKKQSEGSSTSSCQQLIETEEHNSLFDNEDAFILEESANPFAQGTPENLELIDAPLWEQDERSEFEPIYFDFDQYKIKPEQRATLDRTIAKIKQSLKQENTYVVVEGHACKSAGTPRYNIMLSEQRAKEVKKAMVHQGVSANKIKTTGRGSEMCKVQSGTREQQAPNRRVEFYIVYEQR